MTAHEIREFLSRQHHGVLATVEADGSPHAAVVGLATREDGSLVFDTLDTTRKAANLRRDARAAVTVYEGARTVQLHATVLEPVGALRDDAVAAYLQVFPDGHQRLEWPGLTHFVLCPTWVRYSDFDQQPPLVIELPHGFSPDPGRP